MFLKGDVILHAPRKMDPDQIRQGVPGEKKIETGEPHRAKLKMSGTATGSEMCLGGLSDHFPLAR